MSLVDIAILILKLIVAALQLLDAVLKYLKLFRFKSH
ncbi:TPA: type I toxin-antitoxin system toxin TisB [Escherichia coli]|nr:type I toxin-antitoxin system toxin TisB [Escherichia coli]